MPAVRGSSVRSWAVAVRAVGPRRIAEILRQRAWSESREFGLACESAGAPPARRAKVPVVMQPMDGAVGTVHFTAELDRVGGEEYRDVHVRDRMCANGVRTLYMSLDPDGKAIYAQWLIAPGDEQPLQTTVPNQFPNLAPHEWLVEGAYTFVAFRRMGAMGDGMHQLLMAARDAGARRVITYVSEAHLASLRGCANAGFTLDHVRVTRQRFNVRRARWHAPDSEAQRTWAAAIAPRS
jgi:RimJ/RimL family protein N-acetyltransferase